MNKRIRENVIAYRKNLRELEAMENQDEQQPGNSFEKRSSLLVVQSRLRGRMDEMLVELGGDIDQVLNMCDQVINQSATIDSLQMAKDVRSVLAGDRP